jgi:hypothetical protein
MLGQLEATNLNLYRTRPDEPHARRHYDEELIPRQLRHCPSPPLHSTRITRSTTPSDAARASP